MRFSINLGDEVISEAPPSGRNKDSICHESSVRPESETGASKMSRVSDEHSDFLGKLIKHEESNVRRAKILVFAAVFICATSVCLVVFFLSKATDHRFFEAEYENFARQIKEQVQWEVQYNFALMQQMSAAVTSSALIQGSTMFPLFTVPHFEISGGYVDGMGGIMNLAYAPLVTPEMQPKWERYASETYQSWITESARLKISHPGHRDPLHGTVQDHEHDRRRRLQTDMQQNFSSSIFRWENGERIPEKNTNRQQLLAPIWQLSPSDTSAINTNLFSDQRLEKLFKAMASTNQTVLSEIRRIGDMYDFAFDPIEKHRKEEPHSFLLEPVYSTYDADDRELVGLLVGLTSWGNLFTKLLYDGADGIFCVVTDSCGDGITFLLNGREAQFLGNGDLHEPIHDSYRHTIQIERYETHHDDLCYHEVHIYPSTAFIGLHKSENMKIYASIFGAFIATGMFLSVYDTMVTRRQKKTAGNFNRTRDLVDSLFPSHVRDRLLEGSNHDLDDDEGDIPMGIEDFRVEIGRRSSSSRPIADLFPNVTVMFADIAGFTAWSSDREPIEVFTLLEAIYGAFDDSAKNRKVYKIETVGDCYVAVCGLPKPDAFHALKMAQFGHSCLMDLKRVIDELEETLGKETRKLTMRIGLHSGSVTAGVLRGQNARFQLFGDTMNTAARMESTGERGKIQCSSETAALIEAAGKGKWVVPRQEKVFAKGKGEMETFWVWPSSNASEAETDTGSSSSDA